MPRTEPVSHEFHLKSPDSWDHSTMGLTCAQSWCVKLLGGYQVAGGPCLPLPAWKHCGKGRKEYTVCSFQLMLSTATGIAAWWLWAQVWASQKTHRQNHCSCIWFCSPRGCDHIHRSAEPNSSGPNHFPSFRREGDMEERMTLTCVQESVPMVIRYSEKWWQIYTIVSASENLLFVTCQ